MIGDAGPMPLRVAVTGLLGVPLFWICALGPVGDVGDPVRWVNWNCWFVSRKLVALNFEEEMLISWEVLPDIGAPAVRRSPDPWRSGYWVDDLDRMEP